MAEDKAPGTDSTGTEATLKRMGTPPRNPWLERRSRPASAGQDDPGGDDLGEAERSTGPGAPGPEPGAKGN